MADTEKVSESKTGKRKEGDKKSFIIKIAVLAGAGVLLIVLGNTWMQNRTAKKETAARSVSASEELHTYQKSLEEEIAALCASVSGAGRVTVAVTLSGGFTYEYATDYKTQSGGGSSEVYVTAGSGSSESPIYLSVKPPGIAGIGVVCDGGGDASVRRELISLLSAAYGVGTNKIYVTASSAR